MTAQNLHSPEREAFYRQCENGNASHAYLVEGARGTGKREFALWCAQVLLCSAPAGSLRPCGECPACRKSLSGFHPDIHWYGDGEKAVSIGDVRSLIHETGLVPSDGERSVYILQNADRMQAPAQNALLKVFEEPPPGVTIFLLTQSRRSLLPTVRSRGQLISLSRVPDAVLAEQLKTRFPRASDEERASAIRWAQGSPGEAAAFFGKDATQNREKAQSWLEAAMGMDKYRLFSLLTVPKYKRDTLLPLLDTFLQMLFDLLLRKTGSTPALLSGSDADRLGERVTRSTLSAMCEQTVLCRESVEANGNLTADLTRLASELWASVSGSANG